MSDRNDNQEDTSGVFVTIRVVDMPLDKLADITRKARELGALFGESTVEVRTTNRPTLARRQL